MKYYTNWSVWFTTLILTIAAPQFTWAQANLENPQANSFQSGIGVVSGWACRANKIEIVFDSLPPFQANYGTPRGDTQTVCGDTDNGFGFLLNWNLLGDGSHTVRVLADGVQIGTATVTVRTFGEAFLTGGSTLLCRVPHVPVFGFDTYIRWQQSLQNFAIERVLPHDAQYQGPECASEIDTVSDDGTTSIDSSALQVALRDLPLEFLSADERASLTFMREEEKLAHDVYTLSFSLWNQQIFQNIAASETTHTEAVLALLTRYQLPDPAAGKAAGIFTNTALQDVYNTFSTRSRTSLVEALIVGAEIEELDIRDLMNQIVAVDNRDILLVYNNLLSASRNHLRAFVKVLANQGQTYAPKYLSREEYNAIIGSAIERGGRRRGA